MSKDFKQYLSDQPIFMFKLVDGTTVIATLEDIKDNIVTIKDAQEIQLIGDSTLSSDMSIHKWMFMSDERTVNINLDNVLSYSELNNQGKQFYSKVVMKNRVKSMVEDLKKDTESFGGNLTEMFNSLLDGLEQQDSRTDDYIGWDGYPKPWPPAEDI